MIRVPVTAYTHTTKGGKKWGLMLLVPSNANLLRGETTTPQYYGFYSDASGLHLVVTVKLPSNVTDMLALEKHRTFEGVEWQRTCWIEKQSKSGLRIYLGKGRASELLKPGKYRARVWSSRFFGNPANALDITI